MTLADLNGDSAPDIVAANRWADPKSPTPSYVCFNDRQGHFPACQPLPTESATSIVAADFDGDGALDLSVSHRDGGQSVDSHLAIIEVPASSSSIAAVAGSLGSRPSYGLATRIAVSGPATQSCSVRCI